MKKQLPLFASNVMNNWQYKGVALVVALAIWATLLHGRKDSLIVRRMQVEILPAKHLSISGQKENYVSVKVSGPRVALKKFVLSGNSIVIDAKNFSKGVQKIDLRPTDFALPSGVKILSIEPEEIHFEIIEGDGK